MRILIIPASYPPVTGGLQAVVHTLASGLQQKDHEVLVVTNRHPLSLPANEKYKGVSVKRILFLPIRFDYLRQLRFDLFFASFFIFPWSCFRLYKMYRDFNPEIVNVHYPDAQIPHVLWLKVLLRFKLVVSLHRSGENAWHGIDARRVAKIICKADATTAVSKWLMEQALTIAPHENAHIIYNGIDMSVFDQTEKFLHKRKYIFAFGRLTRQKGFDLLVNAYHKCSADLKDYDLLIAGDGDEKRKLVSLVQDLGLENRIHFLGMVAHDNIVQMLNACEFVVIPSRYGEAFGLVAVEALAAGKTVVASKVGGLPEVIPAEYGLLVQPNLESLAEGISKWVGLLEQSNLPEPDIIEIRRKFDYHQMISEYEQVLLEELSA